MADRAGRFCAVVGCRGRVERRAGRLSAAVWVCVACERRVQQLAALQERLNGSAGGVVVSDAELRRLLEERMLPLKAATRRVGRGMNVVRHWVETGVLPAVRFGRMLLVAVAELERVSGRLPRSLRGVGKSAAMIAALPRDEREAIGCDEIAARTGCSRVVCSSWLRTHRQVPALRRSARLGGKVGRPISVYWWDEAQGAS